MKFKISLLIFATMLLNAQTMTDEKFIKYKQMALEVIDIMNNQTKTIISCFEHEKSLQNMNNCLSKSGKPIETMISKMIPEQINKLCVKDSDGKLNFVWNNQNYEIIISELNKTIHKNEKNKLCILNSNTVEEYAKCLVKSKV
ncbi:MAG: hypothetical protein PHG81_11340 [Aliarcobacter sp.]|nr:hypothetical protein [Aliarcobacter sp.]